MTKKRTSITLSVVSLFSCRKRMAAALAALIVLASGFDIVVPFITQRLIDHLTSLLRGTAHDVYWLILGSAAAILIATVLARLVKTIYDYQLFRTVTSIEDDLRYRATHQYLSLDALYHYKANSGQIIGRIERGCTGVYTILLDILGQNLFPPLIAFTGVFASLLYKNAWIAGIVLLPIPIYVLVVHRLTGKIYAIEKQVNEQFELVSKEAYDVAGNVLTVKKFCCEHREAANQRDLLARARQTQLTVERLWMLIDNVQTLVSTLGRVSVMLAAGFFVLYGRATVGEFVLYVTLQNMAYGPICQLSAIFPRLRRAAAATERLFALMAESSPVSDKPGAPELAPLRHTIEFRDVWFGYGKDGRWVLKNINVTIPSGATVALVGRSGGGKTTFVNLLLRSFDPQEGQVLIDGVDVRDITQESLRRQVAVVPQEVDLFSRTIAENISYGRPNAAREEIEQAGRSALAHEFIMDTESGYETVVGERGLRLSGGERQRVGIARALLRDPRILIMDEATSHLDTESERLIQQATDRLIEGRTAIVIAHRLSTILNADKILVFDDGRIEACGTHDELLRTSKTYRQLHRNSFEAPPKEEPAPAESH